MQDYLSDIHYTEREPFSVPFITWLFAIKCSLSRNLFIATFFKIMGGGGIQYTPSPIFWPPLKARMWGQLPGLCHPYCIVCRVCQQCGLQQSTAGKKQTHQRSCLIHSSSGNGSFSPFFTVLSWSIARHLGSCVDPPGNRTTLLDSTSGGTTVPLSSAAWSAETSLPLPIAGNRWIPRRSYFAGSLGGKSKVSSFFIAHWNRW